MSHHVVEVRDLCYAYPDGTQALKGVSFRLAHGTAVAMKSFVVQRRNR